MVLGSIVSVVSGMVSDNIPEITAQKLKRIDGDDGKYFARYGVMGAIIDPSRPNIEQNDNRVCLTFVGNISAV